MDETPPGMISPSKETSSVYPKYQKGTVLLLLSC